MEEDAVGVAKSEEAEATAAPPPSELKKKRRGFMSRLWKGIFGRRSEDFEKKLEHLSKEEAAVLSRMKLRAVKSRKAARNVVVLSVVLEILAVMYAIIATRTLNLTWQMRAIRVFPMFALPPLSMLIYSGLVSFTRMFDRKDQKTLERLRAERKQKIDELKERTNYYITQQLIQRYDLDPAAKAAAATVLASKLGEESGLKVHLAAEDNTDSALGRGNDAGLAPSSGLRNRRRSHARSHSTGSVPLQAFIGQNQVSYGPDGQEITPIQDQRIVDHYSGTSPNNGGWLARIAALLVGEDPSQCYALICGSCHMHNGLARKEDFPHVTYYCPHCRALNRSRQPNGLESGPSSGRHTPLASGEGSIASGGNQMSPVSENGSRGSLATVHELPSGDEEGNDEDSGDDDRGSVVSKDLEVTNE